MYLCNLLCTFFIKCIKINCNATLSVLDYLLHTTFSRLIEMLTNTGLNAQKAWNVKQKVTNSI